MSRNAILLIADDNQFAPAVFLATRLAALRGDRDVDILLATDSPRELERAKAYAGPFTLMDISRLHGELDLPPTAYFTRATYLSLFVPALLVGKYQRLLYIDIDTYPESDMVFRLFDLDLGGHMLAAVRDQNIPFYGSDFNREELTATLGIRLDQCLGAKYMNSGVMLIDLAAYRAKRFEREAVKLIAGRKVPLRLPDQTVFNALLRGKWQELSPAFNMLGNAWASPIRQFSPPVIVHFTGSIKPWHRAFLDDHPMRRDLPAFLRDTPWSTFLADINAPQQLVGMANPNVGKTHQPTWRGENFTALIHFLRTTRFADVEQGITVLDPSALPELPQ